jgi:anti-sigma-K factor RskA
MTHPHEARLQDYLDELLCREERAELEAHLVACADCTEEVRRARELQRALRELPRELPAPAHLRAAINARIDARPLRETEAAPGAVEAGRTPRTFLDRSLRSLRPALAAAALALVALTALVTAQLVRQGERGPAVSVSETGSAPRLLAVERPYQRAADELNTALTGARDVLAPETIRILEENLRVIDTALAEARAALREDPGNGAVLELLRATHERRLDLLRQARRWSQAT